jgi:hypothetical protein
MAKSANRHKHGHSRPSRSLLSCKFYILRYWFPDPTCLCGLTQHLTVGTEQGQHLAQTIPVPQCSLLCSLWSLASRCCMCWLDHPLGSRLFWCHIDSQKTKPSP